ncbi:hypothetical protein H1R20_g360, partial [Candolleomyces eurysporus]
MYSSSLLLALLAPGLLAAARVHSLPEDPHANPKYRVTYLNGLPVLGDTAARWLRQGLRGGEAEFLDQPWQQDPSQTPLHRKEIGSGDIPVDTPVTDSRSFTSADYTIELMKMGPKSSYVCYIPKPSESASTRQQEESETDATPARSWSLLQPLSGTCLYHRQGWFTYSYCHNKAIRQFKELVQPASRLPAGTYKPEEDPEFHCSMVTTDHILFVKEAKTCSYVLVIHTPRLCGEPGFKSKRDSGEEAPIRCREVVDVLPLHDPLSPSKVYYSEQPFRIPRRKTVLPTPAPKDKPTTPSSSDDSKSKEDIYSEFVKQAVEAFLQGSVKGKDDGKAREGGTGGDLSSTSALKQALENGDVIVEFVDDVDELPMGSNKLVEALIAAGFDVRSEVISTKKTGKGSGESDSRSSSKKGGDEDKDSSAS